MGHMSNMPLNLKPQPQPSGEPAGDSDQLGHHEKTTAAAQGGEETSKTQGRLWGFSWSFRMWG